MSRRTVRMRAVLVSWRVANWKRSLNISSRSSRNRTSGLATGSAVFFSRRPRAGFSAVLRGCRGFLSANLEALLDHEFSGDRQLVRREAQGLGGQVLADAADLEQYVTRLHYGDVVIG